MRAEGGRKEAGVWARLQISLTSEEADGRNSGCLCTGKCTVDLCDHQRTSYKDEGAQSRTDAMTGTRGASFKRVCYETNLDLL